MTKLRFFLVSLCLLSSALTVMAQIQNGEFSGTVTDPSNAAVPGAKVSITNQATNFLVTVTTNQSGVYDAKELPVGVYKISVEHAGFKSFTDVGVTLNAGTVARVDVKLELGQTREVVEVTGEVSAVNTEDSKLSTTITSAQIANLPLNGRNVYDLMQMAPGAVNVMGVDFEAGHNTVVNGVREDFNGFLINGVSNKDISGGQNNVPIEDTVEEFQQLQLNMSAQYGTSAGSINNLVTKSGTNTIHGSLWEYVRNSDFDANPYFLNQAGVPRLPLHFNQFGGTIGGPIIKDKLFFFGSYQGDRFLTAGTPETITVESPAFRQAVESALPNSTAALLYKNFAPSVIGSATGATINSSVPTNAGGQADYTQYLCASTPITGNAVLFPGPVVAGRLAKLLGVTAADQTNMAADNCPTGAIPGIQAGVPGIRTAPFLYSSVAVFGSQTQSLGNLFNGNEGEGKIDYLWDTNNRMFAEMNWDHNTDKFGGNNCNSNCTRGFNNPNNDYFPNAQFSFVHTFSAKILNELRLGYTQNNTQINTNIPGVPDITFDDGVTGFGSYNGYPQFFKDHVYTYSDMVSINHGRHSFKIGADINRNLENSEFNVARPSYAFTDPLFFAADTPGGQAAGVNPDFCANASCSSFSANPQAQLASNFRHWRNWEVGAYFQDDWRTTKRLTLNLGLRWDFYQRHKEENGLVTTFKLGPGASLPDQVATANAPLGSAGCPVTTPTDTQILAGVCGPGGFATATSLGPNEYKDFGPRVGFAYDVFGDGKTSFRGGFGVSYEGTLYNPLSNSRWNPPYYSFNLAFSCTPGLPCAGDQIVYGPTVCPTPTTCGTSGAAPAFTGAATNPGQGIGAQAVGNLSGWAAANPDTAFLTGIVLPQGIKDPYVYNDFVSLQREIRQGWIVELDYVGTVGHRLFRAQQINRQDGGGLPAGTCVTNNVDGQVCSLVTAFDPGGVPNANYGILRQWENANNSAYNGLQAGFKKHLNHGVLFNANYTWSHSIDNGSSWHDAATTAAGAAGGDGYSTDVNDPRLDRGNSVFDIRQRLVLNYVWNLPGQHLQGRLLRDAVGGWSLNGIWAMQTGAHWSPYARNTSANLIGNCTQAGIDSGGCINTGGEWTLDGQSPGVDRPDSNVANFQPGRYTWTTGWCSNAGFSFFSATAPGASSCTGTPGQAGLPSLTAPCLACTGNLGRNQFVGPGQWYTDMTLAKVFPITERFSLKFEAQAFNLFNRANFLLATTGGGAHNSLDDVAFGEAAGTLDGRDLQFGLKLSF
jgi:Carboxypeptidase regulatory-like domain/TonB dependent receptor